MAKTQKRETASVTHKEGEVTKSEYAQVAPEVRAFQTELDKTVQKYRKGWNVEGTSGIYDSSVMYHGDIDADQRKAFRDKTGRGYQKNDKIWSDSQEKFLNVRMDKDMSHRSGTGYDSVVRSPDGKTKLGKKEFQVILDETITRLTNEGSDLVRGLRKEIHGATKTQEHLHISYADRYSLIERQRKAKGFGFTIPPVNYDDMLSPDTKKPKSKTKTFSEYESMIDKLQ